MQLSQPYKFPHKNVIMRVHGNLSVLGKQVNNYLKS